MSDEEQSIKPYEHFLVAVLGGLACFVAGELLTGLAVLAVGASATGAAVLLDRGVVA